MPTPWNEGVPTLTGEHIASPPLFVVAATVPVAEGALADPFLRSFSAGGAARSPVGPVVPSWKEKRKSSDCLGRQAKCGEIGNENTPARVELYGSLLRLPLSRERSDIYSRFSIFHRYRSSLSSAPGS